MVRLLDRRNIYCQSFYITAFCQQMITSIRYRIVQMSGAFIVAMLFMDTFAGHPGSRFNTGAFAVVTAVVSQIIPGTRE